ncbi:hypothetical protein CEXT_254421, partial [Caerostris extrusa]
MAIHWTLDVAENVAVVKMENVPSKKVRKSVIAIKGYSLEAGICRECSCGENGRCSFENGVKICDCNKGYSLEAGICRECNCGDNGTCFMRNDVKTCACDKDYVFNGEMCKECYCGEKEVFVHLR